MDFVLPEIDVLIALESKFDLQVIKPAKYKLFKETYPDIDFYYAGFSPWAEGVIRKYFWGVLFNLLLAAKLFIAIEFPEKTFDFGLLRSSVIGHPAIFLPQINHFDPGVLFHIKDKVICG